MTERKTLFVDGGFTSHSARQLTFKIDCDALTDEDIATLAKIISRRVVFGEVRGVPRGGLRLAAALERYCNPRASVGYLIVDDVLTTGASMEAERKRLNQSCATATGVVIFARGKCPDWVRPLFVLDEGVWPMPDTKHDYSFLEPYREEIDKKMCWMCQNGEKVIVRDGRQWHKIDQTLVDCQSPFVDLAPILARIVQAAEQAAREQEIAFFRRCPHGCADGNCPHDRNVRSRLESIAAEAKRRG